MNNSSKLSKSANLRQKAETLLNINSAETSSPLSEIETLKLVHELEVHRIELEVTNEELLLANSAAQQAVHKYTELYDFAPSGYFTLTKEGTVIAVNFSGAKMLCRKRTDLKNSNFGFFVSDDTKPIFNLFLENVFNRKATQSCEVILSVNDNLPMYVYMNGIVTENGEQCHVNVMNITDQKLAAELIIANKELAFQNEEKEKRANELIIANKELAFQNEEKEKRANELIIANKELLFQNEEKEKRAAEREIVDQELNNSQQELRKFATHLQHVREEEKISLAREIHDDLAQISVALKFDMGMFKRKLSKGIETTTLEELLSKLNDFSGQVDNSIKSARRIINGLRPELIELLGFEEGCKSYLHDFEETHHVRTQFESTIMNLNIDLEQSVALFRILQEALNNIIKHAKATLVKVQLSNSADKLVFQVVDNGVGFDENHQDRQDSYGLIGMKERVFLLEGELFITSKVEHGTSIRVEIPYSSNPL